MFDEKRYPFLYLEVRDLVEDVTEEGAEALFVFHPHCKITEEGIAELVGNPCDHLAQFWLPLGLHQGDQNFLTPLQEHLENVGAVRL